MIHTSCSMKLVFQICLGVLLLQDPSTARLYRRGAYIAKRYGDGMASTGSWDSYQGIESYGWNNRVSPIDEACDICNSFSSSQGTQGYGSPQHMGGHQRGSHDKNPYDRPDPHYRGNGYDNLSPEWNQRYRPRDRHRPNEDELGWIKLTAPPSGGGWSRPPTGIGVMDRKDTYRPGMYPVKVSTNEKGYWDSHPPREIPWEGDRDQSNDTKYSGSRQQGYGGGLPPYRPGTGGYTDDFKPWDQTTKGVSGWDGNGKGIYVASSTPGPASGSSYASGWSGESQKTSTRRPQYSVTIQENPNYSRPGGSNSYIPPAYPSKPASGHIPSGPDQWDRPTSARPLPVSGYGSTSPSVDSSSWDRPTTPRPSSSYDRPSSSWKPSGSGSWEKPTGPNSWDRPSSSYDRPSSSKPSSSWDRPVTNSYDKHSSSWNKPDSWDRPVGPVRESSGYGSTGSSLDNAPLGPDSSYIPPGPSYSGVTTTSPASYQGEHHRFPSSHVNTRPGYENPIPTGTGYDTKRPCSRGGCSRPMMTMGYGRPSGNRYGNSESNYGQSGYGNDGYGSTDGYGGSNGGYGSSNIYGGSSSGGHGGNRGGSYSNENRENWGSGGYNSNRGGSANSGNGNGWGSGSYNSNRGGSSNSDGGNSWGGGGYNSNRGGSSSSDSSNSWGSGYRGGGSNSDNNNNNNNWNSGGYNSNRGSSSGWMNLNSNRGGSSSSTGHRGSGYGYGGLYSNRGEGGGYGDNSSGYGGSSHRYNSDGYGSSNNNHGYSGNSNRGSMYGGSRNNQGGGYSSSIYDSDGNSGYGSSSDSDRYHSRPSYSSSRPGSYDRDRDWTSSMSGGYDHSRPSYGSTSSMRPYEFDRVGHESDYSSSTYRPEDFSSSTASPMDGYSTSTRDPNYDGYGSSPPDAPFQPYDQSSSSRPFLDYDRDGSPYPSDRYDYSDGPPQHHKHTGLYKVPMYNGHSGVGASTEYGFPTKIASNPGNDRDTTTTTTSTPPPDATTSTESPATGN